MIFDRQKISNMNRGFIVFSIITCMVVNVYLYRLNSYKDNQIKEIIKTNTAVFEYIRATSDMNHLVSDNTVRISHYTSLHEPETEGVHGFCPECFDISRHHSSSNKKDPEDSTPEDRVNFQISSNAVQYINSIKKEHGVMNNPKITATDLQLLMSDSIEFAEMTNRLRDLLFNIYVIQTRNLKDCRDMFGTDYLERN